jgi:hypothetical protein
MKEIREDLVKPTFVELYSIENAVEFKNTALDI